MSAVMKHLSSGFLTRSHTNRAVLPQNFSSFEKMDRGFRMKRDCTIYVAKTKALISCTVTGQLICILCFRICKKEVFSRRGSNE